MPYKDRPGTIWLPDRGEFRSVNVGPNPPAGTPLLDGDVNAQRYLKNGVAIDNNTAYPNIVYLDRANTFTGTPQTVQTLNAVTAIQFNGTSIGANTAYANIAYLDRSSQTWTGIQHYSGQPRAVAYSGAVTSLTNASWTKVALNSETVDTTATMHDNVTNNTRVTVPTGGGGFYLALGMVAFASNSTGFRAAGICLNGASTPAYNGAEVPAVNGDSTICPVFVPVVLSATDYLELAGYQNSGGALNTVAGFGVTYLALIKLA